MTWNFAAGILALVELFSLVVVLCHGLPATMTLQRAFPMSSDVDLSQLVARDMARHGRKLQSAATGGIVNFPVHGTYNPFIAGLYYTKVQLGSPPKEFYVHIDSGSDVLWVSCNSCSSCPSKSSLKIPLKAFNPKSSSSSSGLSCSDQLCIDGMRYSEASCSAQNSLCSYSFKYADGSTTSGYYISDTLYFDNILGGSQASNSSAPIVFGCSTAVGGNLADTVSAVDGIFGFGPQSLSVISQLASQGLAPKVFSHCLKGDDAGGGILVLGEIVEPSMVYSPLVPSQPHYNLNLESISVNGQALNIDPSTFAASDNGGTIIDSGTTMAYLAEKAYEPFVTAIDAAAISHSAQRVPAKDFLCYSITSSVESVFPQVTLNFEGNASMDLSPRKYLLKQVSTGGADIWCIGILGIQGGLTLIGDIALKDKIVVYDLAKKRIGWTNYDCSLSVNVSTSKSGETVSVKAGPSSSEGSSSPSTLPEKLTLWTVMTCIIYASILSNYTFL